MDKNEIKNIYKREYLKIVLIKKKKNCIFNLNIKIRENHCKIKIQKEN